MICVRDPGNYGLGTPRGALKGPVVNVRVKLLDPEEELVIIKDLNKKTISIYNLYTRLKFWKKTDERIYFEISQI